MPRCPTEPVTPAREIEVVCFFCEKVVSACWTGKWYESVSHQGNNGRRSCFQEIIQLDPALSRQESAKIRMVRVNVQSSASRISTRSFSSLKYLKPYRNYAIMLPSMWQST